MLTEEEQRKLAEWEAMKERLLDLEEIGADEDGWLYWDSSGDWLVD